jgi:hypothetical protein
MTQPPHDLTRATLAVPFIGGMVPAGLCVLRPFLLAIVCLRSCGR